MVYVRFKPNPWLDILTEEEIIHMQERAKESKVYMDENTFQPYVMIDDIRYDLE